MKVAVIGLGYVGLPLTLLLSSKNYNVVAIDKSIEKIEKLSKGVLPFSRKEPGIVDFFNKSKIKRNIVYATSFEKLREVNTILVSVDTPTRGKNPDYKSLKSALQSMAKNLNKKTTIIIESTLAPKTTNNLVIPIIEKYSGYKINEEFYVAVAPERIRPNYIFNQLTTLSRVIGISSPTIKNAIKKLYKEITTGDLDFVDPTTAETVKTVENTFRDVNIAFANQVAIACEELGVNVWKVRDLVNKSPFHNLHRPGSGVGGHCIPKDPWLLSSSVSNNKLSMIKDARRTNDNMPMHLFELFQQALKEENIDPKKAKVCILGYSYVEDSDDTRNSPTILLIDILKTNKINFTLHDPNVEGLSTNILKALKGANCLILTVGHKEYKDLTLKKLDSLLKNKIIIDGRNFFNKEQLEKSGFIYKGIGNV